MQFTRDTAGKLNGLSISTGRVKEVHFTRVMDAFSPLTETDLLELLTKQAVPFERIEHPAVFTVEQADLHTADAPGAGTKNLFLCDDKKKTYLLVTVPSHKRVDIRQLGNHMGLKKLHFASAEGLYELLGLTPGAVTIMGLVNDQRQREILYGRGWLMLMRFSVIPGQHRHTDHCHV